MTVTCAPKLELTALLGAPVVREGDDVARLALEALGRAGIDLHDGDVLAVASKIVSRAEGRFVDIESVVPSPQATDLAAAADKDPRFVELVLRESAAVSRVKPGVLVVRHRLGFVSANAGIDHSNVGEGALLLPQDPDGSAERIRAALAAATGAAVGVVITDSHGRPFRLGSVGMAIGVAGLPALVSQIGRVDLFGRELEHTTTALADQVAAAADLVAGQADEGRAFVHVRGLSFELGDHGARELVRPLDEDLYA